MTPGHQERAGYGHRLSEQLHSGSENQRDPHLITTEDFPWLSGQSIECVCVIHLLGAHLPSNYVEFHKVLSSFVVQQKLFYLRKESRFLQSLLWFEGENEVCDSGYDLFSIKNIKVSSPWLEFGLFQIQTTFPEISCPKPGLKGSRNLEVRCGMLSNHGGCSGRELDIVGRAQCWGQEDQCGWPVLRGQSSWAQEAAGNEIWNCGKRPSRVDRWSFWRAKLRFLKSFGSNWCFVNIILSTITQRPFLNSVQIQSVH